MLSFELVHSSLFGDKKAGWAEAYSKRVRALRRRENFFMVLFRAGLVVGDGDGGAAGCGIAGGIDGLIGNGVNSA